MFNRARALGVKGYVLKEFAIDVLNKCTNALLSERRIVQMIWNQHISYIKFLHLTFFNIGNPYLRGRFYECILFFSLYKLALILSTTFLVYFIILIWLGRMNPSLHSRGSYHCMCLFYVFFIK